jgi:hypothetical protein
LRNFSTSPRFPGIEDDKLTETVRDYGALYAHGSKEFKNIKVKEMSRNGSIGIATG